MGLFKKLFGKKGTDAGHALSVIDDKLALTLEEIAKKEEDIAEIEQKIILLEEKKKVEQEMGCVAKVHAVYAKGLPIQRAALDVIKLHKEYGHTALAQKMQDYIKKFPQESTKGQKEYPSLETLYSFMTECVVAPTDTYIEILKEKEIEIEKLAIGRQEKLSALMRSVFTHTYIGARDKYGVKIVGTVSCEIGSYDYYTFKESSLLVAPETLRKLRLEIIVEYDSKILQLCKDRKVLEKTPPQEMVICQKLREYVLDEKDICSLTKDQYKTAMHLYRSHLREQKIEKGIKA